MQTQHSLTRFKFAPALGAALFAGLYGSQVQAAPAKVTMAVMAKGIIDSKSPNKPSKPVGVSTVFKPSDHKIYTFFKLGKPVKGYARSVWTAVKVESFPPNTQVTDIKTASLPNLQFSDMVFSNTSDWPRGSYKVALYVNTTFLKNLYFSIK